MRKHRRITAWILTIVLLCSQISLQAFAEEGKVLDKKQTAESVSGETQPDGSVSDEEQTTQPIWTISGADAGAGAQPGTVSGGNGLQGSLGNALSVRGTNSFGTMFASELTVEVTEQKENNGCNVFSVDMVDNTAIVSFESVKDAALVIGIYDEAGEEMLASGSVEIYAGEREAAVDFEPGSLPQYFYIRGFLVDALTYQPLCTVYESPMYTREMQEFLSKTTADFEPDRVLNLDDDETNNFAVYGEDTIVISGGGGQNEVAAADETSNTYVIENAGSDILSLQQGDIFAYPYTENEVLIVKVASMEVNGTTATIIGAEISMEEAFDYIKIDTTLGSNEAVVDPSTCGDGVTYEGMVDYAGRNAPQTYTEIEGGAGVAYKLKFDKKYGDEDNRARITGGVEFKLDVSVKLYLTFTKQYVEVKLDYSAELFISVSGKVKDDIPFLTVTYMFAGIIVELTPSFIVEVAVEEISFSGGLNGTVGFRKQTGKRMENLTTLLELETELKAEGSIFIGLSLEPEVKILSDKIASAKLKARVGAEASASLENPFESEDEICRHACRMCFTGEINGKCEISAKVEMLSKWEYTIPQAEISVKVADFYYSVDHDEFGWRTTCPNYELRSRITVIDKDRKPIPGAVVILEDVETITNSKGIADLWLSPKLWPIIIQKDGYVTVHRRLEPSFEEGKAFAEWLVVVLKKTSGGGSGAEGGQANKVKQINLSIGAASASAAITKSGELYMWGSDQFGQLGTGEQCEHSSTPIKIMSHVREVSFGVSNNVAAITEGGNLYLWGTGKLGDGKSIRSGVPVKIMDHVKQVCLGNGYSAAITENGDLYLWGENDSGQLGNGTWEDSDVPVKVMSHVKEVSLGRNVTGKSVAITEEGDLYLWGDEAGSLLENGTREDSNIPVKIMSHVRKVCVHGSAVAAITEDGDLYLWRGSMPVKVLDHVKEVSIEDTYRAAITEEGDLYLWGYNFGGELGDGTYETKEIPVKIMSNVRSVSLENGTSAAITQEGDLYLWGSNSYGRLGNGTWEKSNVPVKVMSHVEEVCIGNLHTAAITEEGELYLWGSNFYGELGNGTIERNSNIPIKLSIPSGISSVSEFMLYTQGKTMETVDKAENEYSIVSMKEAELIALLDEQQTWNGTGFTGLIPDEIYNYYVVRDKAADQLFSSGNLLYIGQAVSDENGALITAFTIKDTYADADIFAVPMHSIDLSEAEVTVSNLKYNGKEQYAEVTVTCGGTVLVEGIDYYVGGDYGVAQEGDYTLIVKGAGLYTGTVSAGYKVLPGAEAVSIGGMVNSSGSAAAETTLQLLDSSGTVTAQTSIAGNHAAYEFQNVAQGSYILRVGKSNHVSRDYPVTVENQDVELNMEIWLTGDVNGDGKIDARDKRILYNHMAAPALAGYEFAVGDVNGDGKINAVDKRMLYNHIAGTAPLW